MSNMSMGSNGSVVTLGVNGNDGPRGGHFLHASQLLHHHQQSQHHQQHNQSRYD